MIYIRAPAAEKQQSEDYMLRYRSGKGKNHESIRYI